MSLRIVQSEQYIGNDYWRWSAWLEGPSAELKAVRVVDWLLHPSFDPAVLRRSDAADGFRIDSSGWGTFVLKARVTRRDDSRITLRHALTLYYPDDAADAAPPSKPPARPAAPRSARGPVEQPRHEAVRALAGAAEPAAAGLSPRRVFLSFGAEDRHEAARLRQTLQTLGVDVVDPSSIQPGAPLDMALRQLQDSADATLALVSSDTPSPWVAREVNASQATGKPTLVLSREALGQVLGLDPEIRLTQVNPDDRQGVQAVLRRLAP